MPIDDVNTTQNVEDSRVENALATPTPTSTAIVTTTTTASKPPHNADYYKKKKKKRGGFGLLKAALLMIRGGKEARKSLLATQNNKGSNANWKKLLGSVRPMHHLPKTAQSPLSSPELLDVQRAVDKIPPPASPVASSSGTMSQYASASSLRDLDNSSDDDDDDEEDDPDVVFDAIRGDELIDTKADEFIAQFYKQIKLQNTNTNV